MTRKQNSFQTYGLRVRRKRRLNISVPGICINDVIEQEPIEMSVSDDGRKSTSLESSGQDSDCGEVELLKVTQQANNVSTNGYSDCSIYSSEYTSEESDYDYKD